MHFRNLFAVAALALSACTIAAPPPATTAPIATPGSAARSFAAAELEWQSAIAVGRALVRRGAIRGATATSVRAWNARARTLIVAGKATTDAVALAGAAAELLGLAAKLDAITGRK